MKPTVFQSIHITALVITSIMSFNSSSALAEFNKGQYIDPINAEREGPLIIEEFVDFECSFCAKANDTINAIMQNYGDQIQLIIRHNPLDFNKYSYAAAQAYTAIRLQNSNLADIWRNRIFENQARLSIEGESFIFELAGNLGIDIEKMQSDMKGATVSQILIQDQARFEELGFKGTPSFLIGTETLEGARPYEELKQIIDRQISLKIQKH